MEELCEYHQPTLTVTCKRSVFVEIGDDNDDADIKLASRVCNGPTKLNKQVAIYSTSLVDWLTD